jgi:putative membrane protein
MKLNQRFTEAELNRIKEAVKNAEKKISGEIVPVIVEKSGDYSSANYKAAVLASSFAFVIMIILDRYVIRDANLLFFYDPVFIFIVVAVVGLLASFIPNISEPIKRRLITKDELAFNSRQRAETLFLEEEVFNTRQRTGIMIFISFFEHEVIVMADKGINKVVEQKQWDKMVAGLVQNIRQGKVVDGIELAIKQCGDLLLEKGFVITADDINELGDELRINGSIE